MPIIENHAFWGFNYPSPDGRDVLLYCDYDEAGARHYFSFLQIVQCLGYSTPRTVRPTCHPRDVLEKAPTHGNNRRSLCIASDGLLVCTKAQITTDPSEASQRPISPLAAHFNDWATAVVLPSLVRDPVDGWPFLPLEALHERYNAYLARQIERLNRLRMGQ